MNAIDALNRAKATPKTANAADALNAATGGTEVGFDLNRAAGVEKPLKTFQDALNAVTSKPKQNESATDEDVALRKTAEVLVNQLFMGTLMKQMRNSPFKDATFSGGRAGEAYAGLFDQRLAETAGGGMAGKLVDVLVKSLKARRGDAARDAYQDFKQNSQELKNIRHDAHAAHLSA